MKKSFFIIIMIIAGLCLSSCLDVGTTITLNFETNGGTYCAPITTNGTNSVKLPKNPTKDNYKFEGWFWDDGVWSEAFTINSILDKPISDTMDLTIYARWSIINKNQVVKPALKTDSFVYDGTAKTVSLNLEDESIYTLKGDITQTNAGNYTLEVDLKDEVEYKWEDGTTDRLKFNWTISKAKFSAEIPLNITAGFGQSLAEIQLPVGWAWSKPTDLVGNTGQRTHNAVFTPTDIINYTESNHTLSIKVGHSITNVRVNDQNLYWNSLSTNHKVYFKIDESFVYNSVALKTFDMLDIPEEASALAIEQLNQQGISQERLVINLKNAEKSVVSIDGSSDMFRWKSTVYSHNIYFLEGENWKFDKIYGKQISVHNIPTDATKMRIFPLAWEYDSSKQTLLKPLPFDVPLATVDPSWLSQDYKFQIKDNSLTWANHLYSDFRVYALIDNVWKFEEIVSHNSYTGNSLHIYKYAEKKATAIRIAPVGWDFHIDSIINNDSVPFHIVRVSPIVVSLVETAQEMITDLRIQYGYLYWESPSTYHSYFVLRDGIWIPAGTSSGGDTGGSTNVRAMLYLADALRIEVTTILFKFYSETNIIEIIKPLPTEIMVEESEQPIQVITDVCIKNNRLEWKTSNGSGPQLYFKVDGQWINYGYYGGGYVGIDNIPEGATDVRLVPTLYEGEIAYSYDEAKNIFNRHSDIIATEFSLL